jgi:hypothetical protein
MGKIISQILLILGLSLLTIGCGGEDSSSGGFPSGTNSGTTTNTGSGTTTNPDTSNGSTVIDTDKEVKSSGTFVDARVKGLIVKQFKADDSSAGADTTTDANGQFTILADSVRADFYLANLNLGSVDIDGSGQLLFTITQLFNTGYIYDPRVKFVARLLLTKGSLANDVIDVSSVTDFSTTDVNFATQGVQAQAELENLVGSGTNIASETEAINHLKESLTGLEKRVTVTRITDTSICPLGGVRKDYEVDFDKNGQYETYSSVFCSKTSVTERTTVEQLNAGDDANCPDGGIKTTHYQYEYNEELRIAKLLSSYTSYSCSAALVRIPKKVATIIGDDVNYSVTYLNENGEVVGDPVTEGAHENLATDEETYTNLNLSVGNQYCINGGIERKYYVKNSRIVIDNNGADNIAGTEDDVTSIEYSLGQHLSTYYVCNTTSDGYTPPIHKVTVGSTNSDECPQGGTKYTHEVDYDSNPTTPLTVFSDIVCDEFVPENLIDVISTRSAPTSDCPYGGTETIHDVYVESDVTGDAVSGYTPRAGADVNYSYSTIDCDVGVITDDHNISVVEFNGNGQDADGNSVDGVTDETCPTFGGRFVTAVSYFGSTQPASAEASNVISSRNYVICNGGGDVSSNTVVIPNSEYIVDDNRVCHIETVTQTQSGVVIAEYNNTICQPISTDGEIETTLVYVTKGGTVNLDIDFSLPECTETGYATIQVSLPETNAQTTLNENGTEATLVNGVINIGSVDNTKTTTVIADAVKTVTVSTTNNAIDDERVVLTITSCDEQLVKTYTIRPISSIDVVTVDRQFTVENAKKYAEVKGLTILSQAEYDIVAKTTTAYANKEYWTSDVSTETVINPDNLDLDLTEQIMFRINEDRTTHFEAQSPTNYKYVLFKGVLNNTSDQDFFVIRNGESFIEANQSDANNLCLNSGLSLPTVEQLKVLYFKNYEIVTDALPTREYWTSDVSTDTALDDSWTVLDENGNPITLSGDSAPSSKHKFFRVANPNEDFFVGSTNSADYKSVICIGGNAPQYITEIHGLVTDGTNPVSGAVVSFSKSGMPTIGSVTTDENGKFAITGVSILDIEYTVQISKNDFRQFAVNTRLNGSTVDAPKTFSLVAIPEGGSSFTRDPFSGNVNNSCESGDAVTDGLCSFKSADWTVSTFVNDNGTPDDESDDTISSWKYSVTPSSGSNAVSSFNLDLTAITLEKRTIIDNTNSVLHFSLSGCSEVIYNEGVKSELKINFGGSSLIALVPTPICKAPITQLKGTVRYSDGTAVPNGTQIKVDYADNDINSDTVITVTNGLYDAFVSTGNNAVLQVITNVNNDNYVDHEEMIALPNGSESIERDLVITKKSKQLICTDEVTADGQPSLDGVLVRFLNADGNELGKVVTGETGENPYIGCSTLHIPYGTYKVISSKTGFETRTDENVNISISAGNRNITLTRATSTENPVNVPSTIETDSAEAISCFASSTYELTLTRTTNTSYEFNYDVQRVSGDEALKSVTLYLDTDLVTDITRGGVAGVDEAGYKFITWTTFGGNFEMNANCSEGQTSDVLETNVWFETVNGYRIQRTIKTPTCVTAQ